MANWAATVAALQPLLPDGRPRLTEELLARPPFRFIHDVVAAVQRATGFPAHGVFAATEQDPRSMDKELKLSYLSKLAAAVEAATGQPSPARPSKIVAGLEPEQTNALLQMLAAAASACAAGSGGAASASMTAGAPGAGAAPPAAAQAAASGSAPWVAANLGLADGEAPVVFVAPKLDVLLPALARRVGEARAALGGARPEAAAALQQVDQVAGIAADAAVLAKCLEELRGSAAAIAAEGAAWARQADKLAARLADEERAEVAAAATAQARMAALDAQINATRQRLAAAEEHA